jgi:hypothetical protein
MGALRLEGWGMMRRVRLQGDEILKMGFGVWRLLV